MLDYAAAALIVLVAALLVVYRHALAAIWFRLEDPRTLGLFRIVFGSLLLGNIISILPLQEYLFSAEGLMTAEEAWARASKQRFPRFSLLYAFDSIEFVAAYLGILMIACAAFTLGLATPITKWSTWFLYLGLAARMGPAAQGDQVFATFLFYLCLSRCGESLSLDAWIRRLRDPGSPRDRAIPAWPRNLMLLHMIPMMCANGLAKSGALWREGDMFYDMLNEPSLQPFPMWEVSAIFGTNLFRVMTWVTHAFEILFPLVLVGLVVDLVRRMTPASPSRKAVALAWVLWFAIGVDILVLADDRLAMNELPGVLAVAAGIAIAVAPLTLVLVRRVPERARRWLLGRRVWASLLVVFAGLLFFVLRVDWFTGVPMACAILLFDGDELGRAWARVTRRAPRATGPARTSEPSLLRRRFVAVLSGFHALAMAAILLPHAEPTAAWRESAERPLQTWVLNTMSSQFWGMFANGDRAWKSWDVVLVVHDELGNSQVVGDGILPVGDERALDRREKVRERMNEKRWRVRHARWVCRRFDVPNGSTVTFFRVGLWVPTPEELAEMGADEAVVQIEASEHWSSVFEYRCGE